MASEIMSCNIIGWTLDIIIRFAGLIKRPYGIFVLFIVMNDCFVIIFSTMFLLAKYMQNLLFEMRDANFMLLGGVSWLNALIYSIWGTS